MAFPTTGVIDAFTYADGSLDTASSNAWQLDPMNDAAADGLSVSSNQVRTTVTPLGVGAAWLNSSTYGPNQEAYFDTVTIGGYFGIYLRLQSPSNSSSTADGYLVEIEDTALTVYSITNAVGSAISTTQTVTALANGDGFGASIIGNTIQAYRRSSGTWSAYGATRTDSTYTSPGYLGVVAVHASARPVIDNFGGGTISDEGAAAAFMFARRRRRIV